MREVLIKGRRSDSTSLWPRFTAWRLGKVSDQVPVCEVNYLLPKTAVIKTRPASPGRKFQLFHRTALQSHGLSETAAICARAGWVPHWGTSTLETTFPGVPSPLPAPGSISQKSELLTCPDYPTRPNSQNQGPPSLLGQDRPVAFVTVSWWTMRWKFFQFRAAAATTTLFSRLKRVCWARTVELFIHFLMSRNLFHGGLAHPCQPCLAFRKPLRRPPWGTATSAVHSLHTPSANTQRPRTGWGVAEVKRQHEQNTNIA